MNPKYYKLNGKKAVPCKDFLEWGKWYETANRRVAETIVGPARVSTVFLGLDHDWTGKKPQIFETMVFGLGDDNDMDRYETWEEAEKGHAAMVEKVRATSIPKDKE